MSSLQLERLRAAIGGENNRLWKGDDASYSAIHHFLIRNFPKAKICDQCREPAKTQYAVIHGRPYSRKREDYRELCPTCHAKYDQGGERNPQARLTEIQVQEIRRRYRPQEGGRPRGIPPGPREGSSKALAAEFGVSHTTILRIVRGIKWSAQKG